MKLYDGVFILRPDLVEEQAGKAVEGIAAEIVKAGGEVGEQALSHKQRLAYRLGAHDDGFCLCLKFSAPPKAIGALTERFKGNADLLRHIITTRRA